MDHLELTVSDILRIHKSLVNAVKSGRVFESRLNQAVEKILQLKERYFRDDIAKAANGANHRTIAQKIASLALKTLQKEPGRISPLHQKKISVFAPQLLRDSIHQTSLLGIGKTTSLRLFSDLSPSCEEIEIARECAEAADILLVCSYNAWKNPLQIAFIQSLLDTGKPLVLAAMRDPLDASLFPRAALILKTFSPTPLSIQAVADHLRENY